MISTDLMVLFDLIAMAVSFGAIISLVQAFASVKTKAPGRVYCWGAAAGVSMVNYLSSSLVFFRLIDLGIDEHVKAVDPWSVNMSAQWAYYAGTGLVVLLTVAGWYFRHQPTDEDKVREAIHTRLRYSLGMHR